MHKSKLSSITFAFVNIVSLAVFFLPLFIHIDQQLINKFKMPISLTLVTILAVTSLVMSHSRMTSRSLIAFSATACALGTLGRLLDFPAGASGMFFVIIVCGFALGSQFGQFVGMSSMFVSAFLTGGIGPWLGYQVIALGLVGAFAGLASPAITKSVKNNSRINTLLFSWLIAYSASLGLVYGFLINWWSWPFLDYGNEMSFNSTDSILNNLNSYLTFYIHTSLAWDLWALIINAIVMAWIGRHVIIAIIPAKKFLNPEVKFIEDSKEELTLI